MKYFGVLLLTIFSSTYLSGCVSTGASSYAAGSDSGALVANRLNPGAVVSSADEQQIVRQQGLVSREMSLDAQKQKQTTNSIRDYTDVARNINSTLKGFGL